MQASTTNSRGRSRIGLRAVVLGLTALVTCLLVRLLRAPVQRPLAMTRKRLEIDGISTPAIEVSGPVGERPVLVFAGFLVTMEAPRAEVEEFVRRRAEETGRPVIALTLPYVSDPGPVPEGPLPPRLVRWAQSAVDTYQPAEIWGHSLGAPLVQALLEDGSVHGAVTIETSPAGISVPAALRALHRVQGRAVPRLVEMTPRWRRRFVIAATFWSVLPREEVESMLDRMKWDPEVAAWFARVGGEVLDWLHELEAAKDRSGPGPDMMVFADPDPLVPGRAVRIARDRWQETKVIVLPGSAHALYEDPLVSALLDAVVRHNRTRSANTSSN